MALTVSDHDLGTPESAWLSAGLLPRLPPLIWARPARVVVVAPHPDDEVLGAGGLMVSLAAAGTDIEILAVTDGEASHPNSTRVTRAELAERRAKERAEALSRLGVRPTKVTTLKLPDGLVSEGADRLRAAIAARLEEDGAACLAPWRHDGHPDHDAAGQAAADACRDRGAQLAEYLVWAWHWADPTSDLLPWPSARRVDLDRPVVARKRWAIAAFTSQVRPIGPDPGDGAVLPAGVLARFRRPFEVVLV